MGTVRRYMSRIAAQDAAEALRSAGIIATVVSDLDVLGSMPQSGDGSHAVEIQDPADHDRARQVLETLDDQPITAEAGWEDSAATPDLAALAPGLAIPCPSCSAELARDASLDACPACGAPVDPTAIVLAMHGPEALSACYPEPDPLPDAAVDLAAFECARCRYSLRGLPQVSHCPECGLPYSKRRMMRK